jgi:hypothetical protein
MWEVSEVEIWLPDQISGPPSGWRLAVSNVLMFLATMDGHRGGCPSSKIMWVPTGSDVIYWKPSIERF